MKLQEIKQSEQELDRAYQQLINKISEHVWVLAMHDEPIEGIMDAKRGLYSLKQKLLSSKGLTTGNQKNEGLDSQIIHLSKEMLLLIEDASKKLDIDVLEAVKVGLIGEKELKRALILYDYDRMAKEGLKYKDIKATLNERYGWSVSSIEKLVYRG